MENNRRIWTIPNGLSLLRLLFLIPILLLMAEGRRHAALVFILLGIATDFIDGWVARRFNQASDLGRMMDPLIDKVNVLSAALLMALSPLYRFPLWYLAFLVVRELSVLAFGLWAVRRKGVVLEANRPGKNSAFFTGVSVALFILGWQPWANLAMALAVALTLYSTWVYWQSFRAAVRGGSASGSRRADAA
ncbi:MAG: CDP-alcohol phosphatidyltransferase family protein [bacterium]|nr:CDP-alcohol phosphatidyltransferase family protein [bacterium]